MQIPTMVYYPKPMHRQSANRAAVAVTSQWLCGEKRSRWYIAERTCSFSADRRSDQRRETDSESNRFGRLVRFACRLSENQKDSKLRRRCNDRRIILFRSFHRFSFLSSRQEFPVTAWVGINCSTTWMQGSPYFLPQKWIMTGFFSEMFLYSTMESGHKSRTSVTNGILYFSANDKIPL